MKLKNLNTTTDKLHYMIHTIFDNEDFLEDDVEIIKLKENRYQVNLTDEDPSYNCKVLIAILPERAEALCHVIPEDKFCDESVFQFNYTQNIPMHYTIEYIED